MPETVMPDEQTNGESTAIAHPVEIIGQLEKIAYSIPTLKLDRNRSSIYMSILHDNVQVEKIKNFLLGCTSFAVNLFDNNSTSPVKSILKFSRNMLILDKLYNTVKNNILIEKNENYAVWESCSAVTKTKYVPSHLLGDEFKAIQCICYNSAEHLWVVIQDAIQNNGGIIEYTDANPFDTKKHVVKLKVDYISDFKIAGSDDFGIYANENAEDPFVIMHYVSDNPNVTKPLGYVMLLGSTNRDTKKTAGKKYLSGYPNIIYSAYKDSMEKYYTPADLVKTKVESTLNYLCCYCTFKTYNPANQVLCITSKGLRTSTLNFNSTYPIHIHKDYDSIKEGLKHLHEMSKSRGYAFVGYPGTGKTIMMQQLLRYMMQLGIPVINFHLGMFLSPYTESSVRWELRTSLLDGMLCLKSVGYKHVILYCDDIDSYDLQEKNEQVNALIDLFDTLNRCGNSMKSEYPSVVFMTTINNPKAIHSTLIKRSCRIDEVIKVPLPDMDTIKVILDYTMQESTPSLRGQTDSRAFRKEFSYMVNKHITIADITNIVNTMHIYRQDMNSMEITPNDLHSAVDRLCESRANADNTYDDPYDT